MESLEQRGQEAVEHTPDEAFDTTGDIPDPTSVTYLDYDDPFAFVAGSSGAPHIAKLSLNAWVGCGGDVYVLECMGKGHVRIEPIEDDDGGY
jgi:ATP-dependent helicase IRC3